MPAEPEFIIIICVNNKNIGTSLSLHSDCMSGVSGNSFSIIADAQLLYLVLLQNPTWV